MRIDAHHHLWEIARGDYGWLTPDLAPIHRDFTMSDLAPILARHGIQATILVQAAPTEAETRYLLALAARHPVVAGVVGWADFAAADAPDAIARLAADPRLVGLRPMVQDILDDDWLLRPDLVPAFEAMVRHDLVFDALVLPRHLPRLLAVARRHPDLPGRDRSSGEAAHPGAPVRALGARSRRVLPRGRTWSPSCPGSSRKPQSIGRATI